MSAKPTIKLLSTPEIDPEKGLVLTARAVPSPNFDDRPEGMQIEALIVHAISLPPGLYGGAYVEQFFCNQLDQDEHPYFAEIADLKVSSHFFIHRSGELVQFVPIQKRAWHAGKSICMEREAVNDFSIGIELEGCDEDTFETAQYQTLIELTQILIAAVPALTEQHIYGHEDIAPGRKTDPGPGFDWPAFRLALSAQKLQVAAKDDDSL
ncbi:MAG: 1,6-anhydro-N-acetylmuramyl-L-alanine amidase AmpD [Gammaproteobacteria bacterium]|nr:1,6-anhydro-N-acetylmuramyl-L-alanine amidase AmpD [Gammaproteobacteria bacterium]